MLIYKRNSIDFKVNLAALHEMEEVVPMTAQERRFLRNWALAGHDVESNPWNYFEPDYSEMNYLKARRIMFGSSHGPWDSWEYDTPTIWHKETKFFDCP